MKKKNKSNKSYFYCYYFEKNILLFIYRLRMHLNVYVLV
jgi:hypothetical protein